jgi:hypothetical protein
VKIYYWPMLGRGGSLVRMCEEAGVPYEHINDFPSIAGKGSAFGATGSNFAPPIAEINGKLVSQSAAACLFVGKRCGLTAGMDEDMAPQFLADIIDTFEGGLGGAKEKGGAALKGFLESQRWAALAGNIDRSIQGPFYFGAKPTCVDFFLANCVDWVSACFLDRVKSEKGIDAFKDFQKIMGVVEGIRSLESYKSYKGGLQICTKPDGSSFAAGDDLFAAM